MLDGLTALGQSFVLVIVPPCPLSSSSLELCRQIDKDGEAENHAERAEQGLGKALPNKHDQIVRRNFNL